MSNINVLDAWRRGGPSEVYKQYDARKATEGNSPEVNKHSRFIRRCCVNDSLMVVQGAYFRMLKLNILCYTLAYPSLFFQNRDRRIPILL
jgi:hypothetical protein